MLMNLPHSWKTKDICLERKTLHCASAKSPVTVLVPTFDRWYTLNIHPVMHMESKELNSQHE